MSGAALSGASVLVVGGSSGIGLASAIAAKHAGARVVLASRSIDKLRSASDHIGGAEWLQLDASDAVSAAVTVRNAGHFDHVLVSAGSVPPGPVRGGAVADAQAGFASKFWGAYHVAAHAHIAENGSLTLISGVFADRPRKGFVAASCVNAAVEALARALALELAPVRVNAVSPGLVDTPLWDGMDAARKAAYFEQESSKLPVPYIGRPEDIAALVVACMTNPMLTGSVLVADSGRVLI